MGPEKADRNILEKLLTGRLCPRL